METSREEAVEVMLSLIEPKQQEEMLYGMAVNIQTATLSDTIGKTIYILSFKKDIHLQKSTAALNAPRVSTPSYRTAINIT